MRDIIKKAEKTNAERDAIDKDCGLACPGELSPHQLLRTVGIAIQTGLKLKDWDDVAEGYVMLRDFLKREYGDTDLLIIEKRSPLQ